MARADRVPRVPGEAAVAAFWSAVPLALVLVLGRTVIDVRLERAPMLLALGGHFALGALALLVFLVAHLVAEERRAARLARGVLLLAVLGDLVQYRLTPHPPALSGALLAGLALVVGLRCAAPIDVVRWARRGPVLQLAGLVLHALPLTPIGLRQGGQAGWIRVAGETFMPGEIGRPLILAGLALVLTDRLPAPGRPHARVIDVVRAAPTALLAVVGALVLQWWGRDHGPCALLLAGAALCLTLATGRLRVALGGLIALLVALALAAVSVPMVADRAAQSFHPLPSASAPLVSQFAAARYALAWGGTSGAGLGAASIQHDLPVAGSDLALVAVGAELGLLGIMMTLGLLAMVLGELWLRIASVPSGGQQLVAGTLAGLLSVQTCWVASAALGWAPFSGIPLPLVSSGRSSAIAVAMTLAAVCALTAHRHPPDRFQGRRLVGGLQTPRQLAVLTLLAITAIGLATAARVSAERTALNADPQNPFLQRKTLDRGVVIDERGTILERTTGDRSLDTIVRRRHMSTATSALLGQRMPDGAPGLADTIDGALRCFNGPQRTAPTGSGWSDGAPRATEDPTRCRPAGVQLTLDDRLTAAADRALGARPGAVVVLDALTGGVLAVAGRSSSHRGPAPEAALRAGLPPGSSIKMLMAVVAVRDGRTSSPVLRTYRASDGTVIGGRPCGGDLRTMLAASCNQFFARVAASGPRTVDQLARAMAFDQAIPLNGIPVLSSTLHAGRREAPGLLASAGIGQGLSISLPLKLAEIAGAIATDGTHRTPTLVRALCAADGSGVARLLDNRGSRAMSAMEASTVRSAMAGPLQAGGTAARGMPLPAFAAAKTGTAEIGPRADLGLPAGNVAWIVAITKPGPYGRPLAVAVRRDPTPSSSRPTGGRDARAVLERLEPEIERRLATLPRRPCDPR